MILNQFESQKAIVRSHIEISRCGANQVLWNDVKLRQKNRSFILQQYESMPEEKRGGRYDV